MAATPNLAATPRIGFNTAVVAMDNARTGAVATGLVSIITGAATGTRIDRVNIVNLEPAGTATAQDAQVYRFYLYNGTDYRLFHEVQSAATVTDPTTAIAGYQQTVYFVPALVLPDATWQLFAGITKRAAASDDTLFIAHGANL